MVYPLTAFNPFMVSDWLVAKFLNVITFTD